MACIAKCQGATAVISVTLAKSGARHHSCKGKIGSDPATPPKHRIRPVRIPKKFNVSYQESSLGTLSHGNRWVEISPRSYREPDWLENQMLVLSRPATSWLRRVLGGEGGREPPGTAIGSPPRVSPGLTFPVSGAGYPWPKYKIGSKNSPRYVFHHPLLSLWPFP